MRTLTLAIETSNPSGSGCGVAIGEGLDRVSARVLGEEFLAPTGRHDDDLMPAIDRLARRLARRPRDLGRIAVSAGPGGYTALRTAIATAQAIAEATGAALVPVPTACVAAENAPPGPFAVLLASKGEAAHATIFDASRAPRDQGRLVHATDIASLGVPLLLADRFLPESLRAAAASAGIVIAGPRLDPRACFLASIGLPAIDPATARPIYPREPEAVALWKKRNRAT